VLGRNTIGDLPEALFEDQEQFKAWVLNADHLELQALFENPSIGDLFLAELLERRNIWVTVSDDRLLEIVAILATNERMHAAYDDTFMDGYAEYQHSAVFNAAWKLAESVPVNTGWAAALSELYGRLEPTAFSVEQPLELAKRWQSGIAETDNNVEPSGWLPGYQGVRKGLAVLALIKKSELLPTLLTSGDPALRAAAYAKGQLTTGQLESGYQKDGEFAFSHAVHNPRIWRTEESRTALKTIAWGVVRHDKHSDLMAANVFNGMREKMRARHPNWFQAEEDAERNIDPGTLPVTKAELAAMAEQIDQLGGIQAESTTALGQSITKLGSRVGWVWWLALGGLLLGLRHL
jgi:hypothetical protein